jgi:hypothetical protein
MTELLMRLFSSTGPLLLNAFLRYLDKATQRTEGDRGHFPVFMGVPSFAASSWLPPPDSLAFGCGCVALLGLSAMLKVIARPPLLHDIAQHVEH